MMQRKSLIGCMLGPITHRPDIHEGIDRLLERVATGELVSVIDQTFPLAEAAAAHRRAEQRGRIGRVVMIP
jgi:NADPH:quinone reductase-like Zn-dependent oxidoreductase